MIFTKTDVISLMNISTIVYRRQSHKVRCPGKLCKVDELRFFFRCTYPLLIAFELFMNSFSDAGPTNDGWKQETRLDSRGKPGKSTIDVPTRSLIIAFTT